MAEAGGSSGELKESFLKFANQGKGVGKTVTEIDNKNWNKLCKDCKLYNKTCTSTDGDIAFAKHCGKGRKTLGFAGFCALLDELAVKHFKTSSSEDAKEKFRMLVINAGGPKAVGTTKVTNSSVTDRMTDASKYTGSHKERFDADGKGKGIEGRADVAKNDGYVTGYKEGGSYEK